MNWAWLGSGPGKGIIYFVCASPLSLQRCNHCSSALQALNSTGNEIFQDLTLHSGNLRESCSSVPVVTLSVPLPAVCGTDAAGKGRLLPLCLGLMRDLHQLSQLGIADALGFFFSC